MQVIIHSLWSAVETTLALVPLGLAASFSPTLYAAQFGSSAKRHVSAHRTYAPLTGVLGALVFMLILFQFLHPDTLVRLIGSAVSALVVSTIAAILVGLTCIYGGVRLMTRSNNTPIEQPTATAHNTGTLLWFGFMRTFLSVSGLAATFLGANVVATTKSGLVIQAAFTCLFLVIASIPFVTIAHLTQRFPKGTSAFLAAACNVAKRMNFRLYASIAIATLGAAIVLVQIAGLLLS